jgi:tetratricopeptide (TPR) repeat protein
MRVVCIVVDAWAGMVRTYLMNGKMRPSVTLAAIVMLLPTGRGTLAGHMTGPGHSAVSHSGAFGTIVQAQDADALYADRANLASARQAAGLWTSALERDPLSFDPAWKLARVCYWLGGHAPKPERRAFLERGIVAGRQASAAAPQRPEGHFWIAANMGALAESFGLRAGLKYRKPIREELETVLRLDPALMDGSADRALGRWYHKVPGLFGGSNTKAEEHLRASLRYNPDSTIGHFFLAELLMDEGRTREARIELQAVLDAPLSNEWAPEDQSYKDKALALLQP